MIAEMQNFLYFAYGSNMLHTRLLERTPSALSLGTGFITGWRLTFNKYGRDGTGKCDIEPASEDGRVYGVLYEISSLEKPILDDFEKGYESLAVTVRETEGGNRQALAYVACDKKENLSPFHWYKKLVIAGAVQNRFPSSYIDQIRAVLSIEDTDISRRQKNEALIPENITALL